VVSQCNKMVSIIVPVYNVEKYLARCIESVISQTYRNFELLLIDDGSPDNCGKICDEYAGKYPYIHVIHQKNQGQSAARNNAVKVSKGEYITFVDSDDFIENDYLEYLIQLQEKHQSDISIGGFRYLYEGKEPEERKFDNETEVLMDANEALCRMNYNAGFGSTPWAKLYKRELIVKHPFPEGQIYEDLATLYKIVGDSAKISLGNRVIYYWVQRAGSTMRMAFDERQMAGMTAVEEQIKYVEKRYPDALPSVKYRYVAKAMELIAVNFNSGSDKEVFNRLRELSKRYSKEVLHDKRAKRTMKMRINATRLGYSAAKFVFGIHEKAKHKLM